MREAVAGSAVPGIPYGAEMECQQVPGCRCQPCQSEPRCAHLNGRLERSRLTDKLEF